MGAGGVRARRAARSRRRGGAAAAIAPESKGETDGEQEEVAGDLTGGSFCAKEGRRKVVDGEAKLRQRTAMASSGLSTMLDRFGRKTTQTGSGRRGVGGRRVCAAPGATNRGGAASSGRRGERRRLCSARVVRARGKGKTALDGKLRGLRARGEERCSGAIADAWKRRRRAQSPVWPASATVPSRRCTVSSFE